MHPNRYYQGEELIPAWVLVSSAVDNFVSKVVFKGVTPNNQFSCELGFIIRGIFVLFIRNADVKDMSIICMRNGQL